MMPMFNGRPVTPHQLVMLKFITQPQKGDDVMEIRKLGKRQLAFLEALRKHNVWTHGNEWSKERASDITSMADALERRGLIVAMRTEKGIKRIERAEGMIAFLVEHREKFGT